METTTRESGQHRLYRSERDQVISGICAGLGKYFGIDPVIFRLIFVLLALNGSGVIIYILMALIVPKEGQEGTGSGEVMRQGAEDMRERARAVAESLRGGPTAEAAPEAPARAPDERRNPMIFGGILVLIGLWFFFENLGWHLFGWFNWGALWPLVLIGVGLALLLRRH
jgi:phage shock protein C